MSVVQRVEGAWEDQFPMVLSGANFLGDIVKEACCVERGLGNLEIDIRWEFFPGRQILQ